MNDAIQTTTEQQQQQQQLLFREQLRNEQPKLDAALKSFASLLVASSSSSSARKSSSSSSNEEGCWSLTECLNVTRMVSKHMNQHIVAIGTAGAGTKKKRKEQQGEQEKQIQKSEIAAQVWNELVASQQKPTKSLGRTSLQLIWQDLELEQALLDSKPSAASSQQDDSTNTIDFSDRVHRYVQRFETLLFEQKMDGGDAPLLWHADRGASELARRAAERQERAAARREEEEKQQQNEEEPEQPNTININATTPFIEELSEDNAQESKDPTEN